MVFLAWTEPPVLPNDPRRSGRVAPCAARLCQWPAPHSEHLPGLEHALARARARLGLDSEPSVVAVGAGEAAEFVEAVGKTLHFGDDALAVVPSVGSSLFDPMAVADLSQRSESRRMLLFASAVHPDGTPASFSDLAALSSRYRIATAIDATLAPWTTARAFVEWTPSAVVAALDRWHDEPVGCWGLSLGTPLGTRTSMAKRTVLNAARLRAALTGLPGVIVSSSPLFETGIVAFRFEQWAPEEAVTVLREAFGVWVAGPPPNSALAESVQTRWLRASVAPATTEKDLASALAAITRVAQAPAIPLPAH
ncbi:MAG: hypothetical protein U0V87_07260 [Acidobacteriota bacterium]